MNRIRNKGLSCCRYPDLLRSLRSLCLCGIFLVVVGCAGPGMPQQQKTAVPITAASDEGDVSIEAPVTTEQEQEESAIESTVAMNLPVSRRFR